MQKTALQINEDGSQNIVQIEVTDDWDAPPPPKPPAPEQQIADLQQQNALLTDTLDSLMTTILPEIMGK